MRSMDSLDARILLAIDDDPDATVLALAQRLGIARNTLTARLKRLTAEGAVREFSRRVDPAALGYGLVAFISVELSVKVEMWAPDALHRIPQIVEMHATTGDADLLLKVVARDPLDLHRVTGEVVAVPEVVRTSTVISLYEEMPARVRPLLQAVADGVPPGAGERHRPPVR